MPVAILTELVSGDVYQWGALMAGSLLGSLPVAIFYSFFVDYYVSSLTGRGEGVGPTRSKIAPIRALAHS